MAEPILISSKAAWHLVLEAALERTVDLQHFERDWDVPLRVQRQLELMRDCVATSGAPADEDLARIDLATAAARHFEERDGEYASWLKGLEAAFRRWGELP
jgi:hypothetical protein